MQTTVSRADTAAEQEALIVGEKSKEEIV